MASLAHISLGGELLGVDEQEEEEEEEKDEKEEESSVQRNDEDEDTSALLSDGIVSGWVILLLFLWPGGLDLLLEIGLSLEC